MGKTTDEKKKNLFLAIDFDGTIVKHDFPRIGSLMPGAKEAINALHGHGHKIIVWTVRNHTEGEFDREATIGGVQDFLDKHGIRYDTINENHPDLDFHTESRKVYADIYIDDRNLGGFPGWGKAFMQIMRYNRERKW